MIILKALINMPKSGIFVLKDESKRLVFVAKVTSFIAFICRNSIDIANGCHKYNLSVDTTVEHIYSSNNKILEKLEQDEICLQFEKLKYKVYRNTDPIKLAKRVTFRYKKALVQVVNSRSLVVGEIEFNNIESAKEYCCNMEIKDIILKIETGAI